MRLTAAEIATAAGGEVAAGSPAATADSFTIDSRVLCPGACFVALVGERDGHDFVVDAFRRGAAVAIVGRLPVLAAADDAVAGTVVRVADPLTALADLGRLARERLAGATVVAVTGSAGKTATKDLLAAALSSTRKVAASPSSYNNEAGVPLTLLTADPDVEVVVVEMGARFAGNVADLCFVARPDAGIVTNVGLAHAGPLGGPTGIVAVKGELLEALPGDGLAVLNADDPATPELARRTGARIVRAGTGADVDVRATDIVIDDDLRPSFRLATPAGTFDVRLALRGAHQVLNASLAAAAALELDVSPTAVAAGLARAAPAPWRMELERAPGGITVLNDAYNASPPSMAAALMALARLRVTGRRFAVLGEMLELGDHAAAAHEDVGRLAAASGVDVLVVVGQTARPIAKGARAAAPAIEVVEVQSLGLARDELGARLGPGDAVLVKASRAVGLEHLAAAVLAGAGEAP